jgi:hypothetical protein
LPPHSHRQAIGFQRGAAEQGGLDIAGGILIAYSIVGIFQVGLAMASRSSNDGDTVRLGRVLMCIAGVLGLVIVAGQVFGWIW